MIPRRMVPRWGWEVLVHGGAALVAFPQVPSWMARAIFPDGLDPRLVLAILRWVETHWTLGGDLWHAPWLYPNRWSLAFSDHLFGMVPVFSLLHRLLGSESAAYGTLFLASFVLCSWGTARLLERLGSSAVPAHLLGLAVAYAPWRTDQISHLQMLWQPALPWLFLAFDRLLTRPSIGRAGAFLGWYLLHVSGGSYLAYFAHLVLGLQLTVRFFRTRRRLLRARALLRLAVTAGVAAGLAMPFFLPYLQARREHGLARPAWEIERYAAEATSWLSPAPRSAYAGLWPEGWVRAEKALFPGFLLGSLAVLGGFLSIRRGNRWSSLELGLLLSGVAFALLAHRGPYLALARVLPGLDGMRVPTRGAPFVLLALAVLSARAIVGLERAFRKRWGHRWRTMQLSGVLLGVVLLAPDLWPRRFEVWERIVVERPEELPDVDRSLGRLEQVRGVAIVPVPGGVWATLEMLRAAHHGKPIGPGQSGYLPPSLRAQAYHCRYPERQVEEWCLGALLELGFSHLLVRDAGLREPLGPGEIWARVGSVLAPDVAQSFELLAWDRESMLFRIRTEHAQAE